MVTEKKIAELVLDLMNKPEQIRNIGIIAHIHHGKTTLTDNLLAGAGMLAEEVAGDAMFTWWHETERQRELTVFGACVSMVHEYEGKHYLINLIDTPGHIDFSGRVTRACRAIDGAIVVVCAVDGVMPQTEAVLRQALRERVKPILFINKTDRLITELKLPPEKIMQRIMKIINDVNSLIRKYAPPEFRDKWQVRVQDGSVAFGSAKEHWALSFPFMQKYNVKFQDIMKVYEECESREERRKRFDKLAPLHKVVLDMVVRHLPSPKEAQRYRIPRIWRGDLNSKYGKALLECDDDGPAILSVTEVRIDRHAGEVATARIWSGTIRKGTEVYLVNAKQKVKIQQVAIYKGIRRIPVEYAKAGNIVALVGIKGLYAGETIVEIEPGQEEVDIEPFEELKHWLEPVVTKAFEPENVQDLPRLIEVLKMIEKEDPTIHVEINQETGEILVSGLGELHLEIVEYRVKNDFKIPIRTSPPTVVYRESVEGRSPIVEGKSPNKHNKLYFVVEPLEDSVYEAIREGELPQGKIKKMREDIWKKFVEYGMDKEEAKRVWAVCGTNVLINMTRGVIHIEEIRDMVVQAFEQMMKSGPVCKEPCAKLKVKLVDAVLHEDAIHRGPAQIIPAVRMALTKAILMAKPILLEPVQVIRIDCPVEYMGNVTKLVTGRRGQILDTQMSEDGTTAIIIVKMPVAEMFGFASDLLSATGGKGVYTRKDSFFEKVPAYLQEQLIIEIRKRKGLPPEIPKPEE